MISQGNFSGNLTGNGILGVLLILVCFLGGCKTNQKRKEASPTDTKSGPAPIRDTVTVIVAPHKPSFYAVPSLYVYNGYSEYKKQAVTRTDQTMVYSVKLYIPETYLTYYHNDGYSYSFKVRQGDTLWIDFKNDIPWGKTTAQPEAEFDFSVPSYFHTYRNRWVNLQKYKLPMLYKAKDIEAYWSDYSQMIREKQVWIDSLYRVDLLSERSRKDYKRMLQLDSLYSLMYLKNREGKEMPAFQDVDLLFDEYRKGVRMYLVKRNRRESKKSDPVRFFDSLIGEDSIPEKTRLCFLYEYLGQISEAGEELFTPRAQQFLGLTGGDTVWASLVEDITPLKTLGTREMMLYDREGQVVAFQELMDSLKGQVVYIDVCASWCAPCREGMPAALDLRRDYAGKPVRFLYFGYEDRAKAWWEMVREFGLEKRNASAYLIASPQAEWVRELKIKSVPRYLLYDREGRLVHGDAPGPEKGVRDLVNSLL